MRKSERHVAAWCDSIPEQWAEYLADCAAEANAEAEHAALTHD